MNKLGLFIIIFISLSGCDRQKVSEQFQSIPGHKWKSSEPVNFNISIEDTASPMNVMISVRNTGQYQYSNLYLFVTAISPDGSQVRDTTEITLADVHGKWLGKGSAAVYTLYYPFRENIRFPRKGIYRFRLEQAMWIRELEYISDIGLRIEKAGSK
jgi:gliding motility-associated lipoprotein GldH